MRSRYNPWGRVKKSARVSQRKPNKARLYHLLRFLKSWRFKTKGERVECQRHHLKNDLLSQFKPCEIWTAIALAKAGRGDEGFGGQSVSFMLSRMNSDEVWQDPLNIIYEFKDFERYLEAGLEEWESQVVSFTGDVVFNQKEAA